MTAIDYTTDVGKVRLLISDLAVDDATRKVYTDEQITAFLAMNRGVKRAAAAVLDAMAFNLLQVSRDIKTQDVETKASATAQQMRALAVQLRAEADRDEDDQADLDNGGFSIVDYDPFAGYCGLITDGC